MSYYGYVKREKDSIVDWKAITGNISSELTRVTTDRAKKREELEQASRDHMAAADSVETGSLKSMNDLAMDVANKQKQFGYAVNTLLKSGDISPNDFSRIMQTQMENVKNFSSVAKSVQSKYAEDMERFNAVTTSAAEKAATLRKYESFDPASNMYTIDPRTGLAVMTKIDKNGNPIQGKKGSIPIQSLSAMMEFKMDAVDAPKMFSDVATKFAEFTRVSGFSTITDARQNTEFFNDAKKSYIDSFVADKNTFVSILSDFYGYEISDDPNADPKKFIIMDLSKGYPEFTISEELEQEGRGKIDSTLETMIGRDEKRVYQQPREPSGRSIQEKDYLSGYGIALDIVKGGQDGAAAAQKITANKSMGIPNIYQLEDSIVVQREGAEDIVIEKFLNGQRLDNIDLATSLLVNIYPEINPGQAEEIAQKYLKQNPGIFDDVSEPTPFGGARAAPIESKTTESFMPGGIDEKGNLKTTTIGNFVIDKILEAGKVNTDRIPLLKDILLNQIPLDARVKSQLNDLKITDASTGAFGFNQKVKVSMPGMKDEIINFDNENHLKTELIPLINKIIKQAESKASGQGLSGSGTTTSGRTNLNASNFIKK